MRCGLVFFRAQGGMEAAENEIQSGKTGGLHVAFTPRIEVQLYGTQLCQPVPTFAKLSVDLGNLISLSEQLLLVDAAGNFESFGVVRDGHVLIATLHCCRGHFCNRAFAITPGAVHLQVAFDSPQPRTISSQRGAGVGQREKSLANIGRLWNFRRIVEPRCDEPL